jgi:hypothetical protein
MVLFPCLLHGLEIFSTNLHFLLSDDEQPMAFELFSPNKFVDDFCRTFCRGILNGLIGVDVKNHDFTVVFCRSLKQTGKTLKDSAIHLATHNLN